MSKFEQYWENGECVPSDKDGPLLFAHALKKRGWVYIAKNPQSSSGALKIGRTSKSPFERMSTLGTAGVEGAYELLHAVHFVDCHWAERMAHTALGINHFEKEFFAIDSETAYAKLLDLQNQEVLLLKECSRNKLLFTPTQSLYTPQLC